MISYNPLKYSANIESWSSSRSYSSWSSSSSLWSLVEHGLTTKVNSSKKLMSQTTHSPYTSSAGCHISVRPVEPFWMIDDEILTNTLANWQECVPQIQDKNWNRKRTLASGVLSSAVCLASHARPTMWWFPDHLSIFSGVDDLTHIRCKTNTVVSTARKTQHIFKLVDYYTHLGVQLVGHIDTGGSFASE